MNSIIKLIGEGKVGNAIERLSQKFEEVKDDKLSDKLVEISSYYRDSEQKYRQNLINYQEYSIAKSKTANSLLQLIRKKNEKVNRLNKASDSGVGRKSIIRWIFYSFVYLLFILLFFYIVGFFFEARFIEAIAPAFFYLTPFVAAYFTKIDRNTLFYLSAFFAIVFYFLLWRYLADLNGKTLLFLFMLIIGSSFYYFLLPKIRKT